MQQGQRAGGGWAWCGGRPGTVGGGSRRGRPCWGAAVRWRRPLGWRAGTHPQLLIKARWQHAQRLAPAGVLHLHHHAQSGGEAARQDRTPCRHSRVARMPFTARSRCIASSRNPYLYDIAAARAKRHHYALSLAWRLHLLLQRVQHNPFATATHACMFDEQTGTGDVCPSGEPAALDWTLLSHCERRHPPMAPRPLSIALPTLGSQFPEHAPQTIAGGGIQDGVAGATSKGSWPS